jgi:hypothetical protein
MCVTVLTNQIEEENQDLESTQGQFSFFFLFSLRLRSCFAGPSARTTLSRYIIYLHRFDSSIKYNKNAFHQPICSSIAKLKKYHLVLKQKFSHLDVLCTLCNTILFTRTLSPTKIIGIPLHLLVLYPTINAISHTRHNYTKTHKHKPPSITTVN